MFDTLQSQHVRDYEDVEGFGIRSDSGFGSLMVNTTHDAGTGEMVCWGNYKSVKASGTKAVSFSLLSGILNQGKMLPLKYCPITIEIEPVKNHFDAIVSGSLTSDSHCAGLAET